MVFHVHVRGALLAYGIPLIDINQFTDAGKAIRRWRLLGWAPAGVAQAQTVYLRRDHGRRRTKCGLSVA